MKKKAAHRVRSAAPGGNHLAAEKAFSLLTHGPDSVDPPTRSASTPSGPPSPKSGAPPKKSPTAKTFCTGKSPSPASGTAGRTTIQSAASTPSSATRPGTRSEQPEVEWFALRDDEIALAPTAARRKVLIKQRTQRGDELALAYQDVRQRSKFMRAYVKESGAYPILSGGRVNLYSLFVERAMNLTRPKRHSRSAYALWYLR